MLKNVSFPRKWTSVPFGRVAPRVQDSGRPDLEPLSVFLGAGVVPRSSREDNHNQLGEDIGKYLVVEPGDIVFNKLRTWQGGLGASRHRGLVSPAYFVCRPRQNFDPTFLQYLLLSSIYLQELTRISKWQPPSQFDIGWEQLKLLPIYAPDIAGQNAIAKFLDRETARIDALIKAKARLADLIAERVEEQVAGILLHINDSHRKDPADIPLDVEVPSGWEVVPLRELLSRITYGFTNPMPTTDDGPLLLTANDIQDGHVAVETSRRTSWEAFHGELSDKSRPRAGDILMTKDGTLGRIAVHDGTPACINQSVALLRAQPGVDPYLLCEILRARPYREALIHNAGGTTIKHLYISRVSKLRIAIPAATDRSKCLDSIRMVRDNAEKTLALLDRQIGLLREHREALITAAVTGELEILGVSA